MAEETAEKGDAQPQKPAAALVAEEEVRRLMIAERRRKIGQRRALRIVLQLAKRRVTVDFLCLALNFIEPQHWDDAIDERNAEGFCGYVFCVKKPLISEGKNQRYRICSKTNRVYDMENYNPFCSVWCAKAARHVRSQIAEKPVMEREGAQRLALTFLDQDSDVAGKAAVTEEKDQEAEEEEEKDQEEEEEEEEDWLENKKEEEKEEDEEEVKEKAENLPIAVENVPPSDVKEKKAKRSSTASRQCQLEPKTAAPRVPPLHGAETAAPRVPPLHGAKTALRAWITADSLAWLEGRPLSCAAEAEAEAEADRGRGRRFLARRSKKEEKEGEEEGKEEAVEVTLPLVDSVSQDAIRRRIVGAKLDSCLRAVAAALQLEVGAVRTPLRQLLRSFAFSATNIVLRPREWRAAAVLLLELVARRTPEVRAALDAEGAAAVLRGFAEAEELGLQELVDECAMLTVD